VADVRRERDREHDRPDGEEGLRQLGHRSARDAIATRAVAKGEGAASADITRLRRLGNRGLSSTVNTLFATRYSDLCYGYNAFWRRCLPAVAPDVDGFEVETLINIRAARARLRVVEVPSFEHERIHGVSNLNALRDGVRVLRTIARERLVTHRGLEAVPSS